jgi:heme/copper-type cytochrome/quinol oxidase subunit 4
MKSKNLALLLTALFILIAFAIVYAHTLEEGVAIVCIVLLSYITTSGLYYSIYDIIKIIRKEE